MDKLLLHDILYFTKINWQLDNESSDNFPFVQSDIMIENNKKILIIDNVMLGHG